MRGTPWTAGVATVMAVVIGLTQVASGFAGRDNNRVTAAFAGIHFENLAPDVQGRILDRMLEILEGQPSLEVVKPTEVEETIGKSELAAYLQRADSASFAALAHRLDVDYLYAGRLSNNARESDRILLVGYLFRFDRSTGLFHRFEVLKYYDTFGVELIRFEKEYVKTIVAGTRKHTWPWLVLAGVGVAGIIALTLASTKKSGESKPPPPPIRP